MALVFAAIALVACGPTSAGTVKDLDIYDWVGHSSAHLIQSWGKPHHDYPTAEGGQAIGYLFRNQAVMGTGLDDPAANSGIGYNKAVTGQKSQVLFQATNCLINFTVDRNGIIDDATTTVTKCSLRHHDDMHPPAALRGERRQVTVGEVRAS